MEKLAHFQGLTFYAKYVSIKFTKPSSKRQECEIVYTCFVQHCMNPFLNIK